MSVLITGGSGFIGSALAYKLKALGHTVFIYSHQNLYTLNKTYPQLTQNFAFIFKDTKDFPKVDAIVNLGGESISTQRLTQKRLNDILHSRLDLIELLKTKYQENLPKVFIQASATNIYDDGLDITEDTPLDKTFIQNSPLAKICSQVEAKVLSIKSDSTRVVLCRFSTVIGKNGGICNVLKYLPRPYFLDGNNYLPYIKVDTAVNALIYCLENSKIQGAVNMVDCNFNTLNEVLSLAYEKLPLKNFPIPWLKSLVALDRRGALMTVNQRIVPQKLLENGFKFK